MRKLLRIYRFLRLCAAVFCDTHTHARSRTRTRTRTHTHAHVIRKILKRIIKESDTQDSYLFSSKNSCQYIDERHRDPGREKERKKFDGRHHIRALLARFRFLFLFLFLSLSLPLSLSLTGTQGVGRELKTHLCWHKCQFLAEDAILSVGWLLSVKCRVAIDNCVR